MTDAARPTYGFDAPRFTRNALAGGAGTLVMGGLLVGRAGAVGTVLGGVMPIGGVSALLPGLCLVAYGLRGKYRVRDRMIAMVPWRGDEHVLDVGTGQGCCWSARLSI